jgi:hypothetical protein
MRSRAMAETMAGLLAAVRVGDQLEPHFGEPYNLWGRASKMCPNLVDSGNIEIAIAVK